MEIKKELSQMTGKAAGAAIEVQHGMEAAWLARSIKQELDTGISMEAVITGRLPTMDTALVQEDVSQLMQGIQSLRESTRQTVNVEWVRQHLNDALQSGHRKARSVFTQSNRGNCYSVPRLCHGK